jgi:hypothetical protein
MVGPAAASQTLERRRNDERRDPRIEGRPRPVLEVIGDHFRLDLRRYGAKAHPAFGTAWNVPRACGADDEGVPQDERTGGEEGAEPIRRRAALPGGVPRRIDHGGEPAPRAREEDFIGACKVLVDGWPGYLKRGGDVLQSCAVEALLMEQACGGSQHSFAGDLAPAAAFMEARLGRADGQGPGRARHGGSKTHHYCVDEY